MKKTEKSRRRHPTSRRIIRASAGKPKETARYDREIKYLSRGPERDSFFSSID